MSNPVLVGNRTAGSTPMRLKFSRHMSRSIASRYWTTEGFHSSSIRFVSKRSRLIQGSDLAGTNSRTAGKGSVRRVVTGDVARAVAARCWALQLVGSSLTLVQIRERSCD